MNVRNEMLSKSNRQKSFGSRLLKWKFREHRLQFSELTNFQPYTIRHFESHPDARHTESKKFPTSTNFPSRSRLLTHPKLKKFPEDSNFSLSWRAVQNMTSRFRGSRRSQTKWPSQSLTSTVELIDLANFVYLFIRSLYILFSSLWLFGLCPLAVKEKKLGRRDISFRVF